MSKNKEEVRIRVVNEKKTLFDGRVQSRDLATFFRRNPHLAAAENTVYTVG